MIAIKPTRSYAALQAADLEWIVGPGYSLGGYILEKNHDLEPCKTNLEPWKTMKTNLEPLKTNLEPCKTNLEPWKTIQTHL